MLPSDPNLPFFAYGIFKPGQLAYFQLAEAVVAWRIDELPGELLIRDGLPAAVLGKRSTIAGAVVTFAPNEGASAYSRIAAMEPREHYRWEDVEIAGKKMNVLVARVPTKGGVRLEGAEWDGWDDPLFTAALDVVRETRDEVGTFDWDLKPLFRMQMAYLLLWSSIERYVSLRYHLGTNVMEKVNSLAEEKHFCSALWRYVTLSAGGKPRTLQRADRPDDRVVLDPKRPTKAIEYYYQVRSNITHRGKAAVGDHSTLQLSLSELLAIFRDVLRAAKADSEILSATREGGRR